MQILDMREWGMNCITPSGYSNKRNEELDIDRSDQYLCGIDMKVRSLVVVESGCGTTPLHQKEMTKGMTSDDSKTQNQRRWRPTGNMTPKWNDVGVYITTLRNSCEAMSSEWGSGWTGMQSPRTGWNPPTKEERERKNAKNDVKNSVKT
jgi:hypothetical protein